MPGVHKMVLHPDGPEVSPEPAAREPGICAIREKRAIMCAILGGEVGMRLGFK